MNINCHGPPGQTDGHHRPGSVSFFIYLVSFISRVVRRRFSYGARTRTRSTTSVKQSPPPPTPAHGVRSGAVMAFRVRVITSLLISDFKRKKPRDPYLRRPAYSERVARAAFFKKPYSLVTDTTQSASRNAQEDAHQTSAAAAAACVSRPRTCVTRDDSGCRAIETRKPFSYGSRARHDNRSNRFLRRHAPLLPRPHSHRDSRRPKSSRSTAIDPFAIDGDSCRHGRPFESPSRPYLDCDRFRRQNRCAKRFEILHTQNERVDQTRVLNLGSARAYTALAGTIDIRLNYRTLRYRLSSSRW